MMSNILAQSESDLNLISNTAYFSDDGKYHFALGEVITQDFTSSNVNVTSGFYQDRLVITNIKITDSTIDVKVFPNPVSTELQIELQTPDEYSIIVLDIEGRSVLSETISESSEVDFSSLINGTYTLTISNKEGTVSAYRIIKIN